MPTLTLHGIDFSPYIAEGSWQQLPPLRAGSLRRAFAGGLRDDTSKVRRAWSCRTVPVSQLIAEAIRGLLEREGAVGLPLSVDSYSAQGDGLSVPVTITFTGAGGKHTGFAEVATQAPRWPVRNPLIGGTRDHNYCIFGFRVFEQGGAWDSFLFRSTTAFAGANLYWKNGVAASLDSIRPTHDWFGVDATGFWYINPPLVGSPPLWAASTAKSVGNRITVTANSNVFYCLVAGTTGTVEPNWASVPFGGTVVDGTVTWKNLGWGTLRVCDLVYVPWLVPDDWAPALYAEHSARSLTSWHKLRASGDYLGNVPATVRGEVLSAGFAPRVVSSSFSVNGEVLELLFEEY